MLILAFYFLRNTRISSKENIMTQINCCNNCRVSSTLSLMVDPISSSSSQSKAWICDVYLLYASGNALYFGPLNSLLLHHDDCKIADYAKPIRGLLNVINDHCHLDESPMILSLANVFRHHATTVARSQITAGPASPHRCLGGLQMPAVRGGCIWSVEPRCSI